MDKTMNQQEYVTVKGERYDTKRPKDSEILKGDGSFMDKTMNQQEYVTVKGERYDIKRPKDSDILKGDGLFVDKTVNHQEYVIVKGERYDIKRPKDSSELFPSSSTFHGRSMYQRDYACFGRNSARAKSFESFLPVNGHSSRSLEKLCDCLAISRKNEIGNRTNG
ncbi:hypothetical protein ANCCAN_13753 [Ancylostoma caninum]|uniref:Uncharacterized protein n=1 Tax=Ancylostoma caninum TaxID=29170 RepID=A0A368G9B8_ANCCA|nr:hypothetical protein ANCCAN_13753 [Ancylostoma caninum]